MAERWFFTHRGITFGPLPTNELDEMVAAGKIGPAEITWLEGYDVQMTVAQYAAHRKGNTLPDWLRDVQPLERLPASPTPPRAQPAPDWLADVQQIEQGSKPPPR